MNKFFAIVLMMMSFSAFAIDSRDLSKAGFDNLPASQQAQIIAQVEQATSTKGAMKNLAVDTTNSILDVGDRFIKMSESLGKGLAETAKQMGIAANEFVKTDVGMITAALLIWNYGGDDIAKIIIHIGMGLFIIVVGTSMLVYYMNSWRDITIKYDKDTNKKVETRKSDLSEDAKIGFTIAQLSILVTGLVTIFSW